jgi:O-antigen/teichoic acid export membrane protein
VFLGPSGVGFLAGANRLQDFLVVVGQLGTAPGIVQHVALRKSQDDPRGVMGAIGSGALVVGCASLPLLLGVAFYRGEVARLAFGDPNATWAVLLVAAGIPPLLLSAVLLAALNGLHAFRAMALHNVLVVLLGLLLVVGLVPTLRLQGAVASVALAAFAAAAVAFVLAAREVVRQLGTRFGTLVSMASPQGSLLRGILRAGGVTYLDTLMGVTNALAVSALVIHTLGLSDNGCFQASIGISRLYLGFLVSSAFTYLLPRLSAIGSHPEIVREQNDALRLLLRFLVPLSAFLVLFRRELIHLLYSASFAPVEGLLVITVPGDLFYGAIWVVGASFIPTGRLRAYALVSVFNNLLYPSLVLALLPVWGLPGAALAYTLGNACTLVLLCYVQWKGTGFRLDRRNLFMLVSGLLLLLGLGHVPGGHHAAQVLGLMVVGLWAGGSLRR